MPIYVASNAFWEPLTIELPELPDRRWYRVADTSLPVEQDIVPEEAAFFLPEMTYLVRPRSTIVLVALSPRGRGGRTSSTSVPAAACGNPPP